MSSDNAVMQRLGLRHPIIQGPFGGGLSTVRLAVAVANLGGLGSFGAHTLAPSAIGPLADEIRAGTSGAFALNLWISDHDPGGLGLTQAEFDRAFRLFEPYFVELGVAKPAMPERFHQRYDDQVEALLEARPPVFSFVFGIPSPRILVACRQRGILTAGTATSIREACALDAAGVDLIVATGFEAGGHRPSFLGRAEDQLMGTLALVPLVADRVKAPVIAAGGIADGRGIRAARALGAQAVQIGTAFLVCAESGTTDAHRDLLFSDLSQQTLLTRAFTGRLSRGMPNRWTEAMAAEAGNLPPFPVVGWFLGQLRPALLAAGRTDLLSLWASQASPNLVHRTAPALFESLVRGMADG